MKLTTIAPTSFQPNGLGFNAEPRPEAFYSGLVVGQSYTWIKGANDLKFIAGSEVLTSSRQFIATVPAAISVGNYTKIEDVTGLLIPGRVVALAVDILAPDGTTVLERGFMTL